MKEEKTLAVWGPTAPFPPVPFFLPLPLGFLLSPKQGAKKKVKRN